MFFKCRDSFSSVDDAEPPKILSLSREADDSCDDAFYVCHFPSAACASFNML